jgi:hypothetical protein
MTATKAPQFLTLRLSGLGRMGLRTSTRCIVGSTIKVPALVLSIFSWSTATICDAGPMWNARRRCGSFCDMVAASSTLNTRLEGIVSKKLDAPYRSGPSKTWIKVKNPKAPAATRVIEGGF